MDLISVIVPVYNVENYLDKCIESIVQQTYSNLEIILVNDGSSDSSGKICDEWGKKDSRIIVIHQENRGGGAARNVGLDCAKGEYVAFVDSDDYISLKMLECLYCKFCDGIDIVECSYCITNGDQAKFDDECGEYSSKLYSMKEAMSENIKDNIFRQLIWNKMYRKKIIGNIRFPIGKKIDDEFWTYQIIGNTNKLIRIDRSLYAYRQQEESVMHLLSDEKRFQAIEAKTNRHYYICKNIPELKIESLENLWLTCIYQGQILLKNEKNVKYNETWKKIKQVLSKYSFSKEEFNAVGRNSFWLKMASTSLYLTCYFRNWLKIGT